MSAAIVIIFSVICGTIIVVAFCKGADSDDQPTPSDPRVKRMREQIKKEGYHV